MNDAAGMHTPGMIQSALDAFGLRDAEIEHLESCDHVNARITTPTGSFFLKILAGYCTERRMQSRRQFLDFLRAGELPVPPAIEATDGRPYAAVSAEGEERLAILVRWIDGDTLGGRADVSTIERCGELLARLHTRSQQYVPPDNSELPNWDDACAPQADGWLARLLAESPLDQADVDVVLQAAARTRTIPARLPKSGRNHGLIHADFHGDNLISDGERIWIIDCDDVGWGYYLFDVAWPAVLFAKHHPDATNFLNSFLRGYERIRPLMDEERALLPEFLLGGGMGALEMIHSLPIANDAPLAREWFRVILNWLELHLTSTHGIVT